MLSMKTDIIFKSCNFLIYEDHNYGTQRVPFVPVGYLPLAPQRVTLLITTGTHPRRTGSAYFKISTVRCGFAIPQTQLGLVVAV